MDFLYILAVKLTCLKGTRRGRRGRRCREGRPPLMGATYGEMTMSIPPWQARAVFSLRDHIVYVGTDEEEDEEAMSTQELPRRTSTPTGPRGHVVSHDDDTTEVPTTEARTIGAMSNDEQLEQQRLRRKQLGPGKQTGNGRRICSAARCAGAACKQQRAYLEGRAIFIYGYTLLEPCTIPLLSRQESVPPKR